MLEKERKSLQTRERNNCWKSSLLKSTRDTVNLNHSN